MSVRSEQVERLVSQIAYTLENELDCEEAQVLQSDLVDAMLANSSSLERFTLVVQHLRVCTPCAEEFEVLRQCAQMDLDASWPSIAALLDQACQSRFDA